MAAPDAEGLLLAESGLPGPRANLELAQTAADAFDLPTYRRWASSADEYLALIGAIGLGRVAAAGDRSLLGDLRLLANDPRWRVREGVAMGLQRLGAADLAGLLDEAEGWIGGTLLEQRAAVAGLCEPALLRSPAEVGRVLAVLDQVTAQLARATDRRTGSYRVLRMALGYGWSVAASADPERGRPLLEKWLRETDRDVRWVMKQNLAKHRMGRLGETWVKEWQSRLD